MVLSRLVIALFASALVAGQAPAQTVVTGGSTAQGAPTIQTPPSVDAGIANGVVKPAGSPSVGNGVANGVVKAPGAPSVGDGIANGVAKAPSVQQQTE